MIKCLECRNYKRSGNIHKCKCYPEITLFSPVYPNEPLKSDCGRFEKFKHKTEQLSRTKGNK